MCGLMKFQVVPLFRLKPPLAAYQNRSEIFHRHSIKIRDTFDLSLLYSEKPGVVNGIFLMFTDDGNSSFVNIYGEIDFQKLGTLFGQLLESNSGESISETVRNWINVPMPHGWEVKRNPEKPDHAPKSETTATHR